MNSWACLKQNEPWPYEANQCLRILELVIGKQSPTTGDSYLNIPYDYISFLSSISIAKEVVLLLKSKYRSTKKYCGNDCFDYYPSFLDVGCGLGIKMLLASMKGWLVRGVDKNPEYLKIAKKMSFHLSHLDDDKDCIADRIVEGDLLDYPYYGKMDCIYTYRPINHHEKKFKKLILNSITQPCVVIDADRRAFLFNDKDDNVLKVYSNVFLIGSQEDRNKCVDWSKERQKEADSC